MISRTKVTLSFQVTSSTHVTSRTQLTSRTEVTSTTQVTSKTQVISRTQVISKTHVTTRAWVTSRCDYKTSAASQTVHTDQLAPLAEKESDWPVLIVTAGKVSQSEFVK